MITRRASLALLTGTLTSCAFGEAESNSADLVYVEPSALGGPCALVDVKYNIFNGTAPSVRTLGSAAAGAAAEINSVQSVHSDRLLHFYVQQPTDNSCFAACLSSVWRCNGLEAHPQSFMQAATNSCGLAFDYPPTFLQIVSTIFKMRTGEHFDFLRGQSSGLEEMLKSGRVIWTRQRQYENGVHLSASVLRRPLWRASDPFGAFQDLNDHTRMSANLYAPRFWFRRSDGTPNGGVYPIGNTGDMVSHLANGRFVLLGFAGRNPGHTVLVTKVDFVSSGTLTRDIVRAGITLNLDHNTKIVQFTFMDPADIYAPLKTVGAGVAGDNSVDAFLRTVRFALAVDPGVAT